ncbi:MAG: GntR family transcriptional regulator [Anaerolineaceae bacterium]
MLSKPIKQDRLSDQIADILFDRITEGEYLVGSKLPSEENLAELLNTSRGTVRDAYGILEAKGILKRKHGSGTYVSSIARITNTLNDFIDFTEMIRFNGFTPGLFELGTELLHPKPREAAALKISTDDSVLEVRKIFTADDKPIVYCRNVIPVYLFNDQISQTEMLKQGFTEPFFLFLKENCNQEIAYCRSSITPRLLDNCNLPDFPNKPGPNTAVIVIEEINFNDHDIPILWEDEYYLSDIISFELIRRPHSYK